MSERITAQRLGDEAEGAVPIDHPMPAGEDDEDYIDTGAAILAFYCTLVDLMGRCAPEANVIAQGKNDSLRARAILRSLVPLEDLQVSNRERGRDLGLTGVSDEARET